MTSTTDFAVSADRLAPEPPAPAIAPRFGNSAAVPLGAPVKLTKTSARPDPELYAPDVVRAARPVNDVDRTLHPSFPVSGVDVRQADAPLPGKVPNTTYDPWRPLQHLPGPAPAAPARTFERGDGIGSLDADLTVAQFATVARSRAKLDRAWAYAGRLAAHAAEIRAKLATASEHQIAAAIGKAEVDPADVGPLRGELVTVDRQHRQTLDALADIETEHARHEADLAALTGPDGAARARLAEAHAARALAQTAADDASALLARATAHAKGVETRLAEARATEARHDADATARLRAALADGDAVPTTVEAALRISPALEDDLRAATAAVDALKAEHAGKLDALASAHRTVLAAVDGVMAVEAEAAARELQASDARALALRVRLHTFVRRPAGDYVRPTPKPNVVLPNGMVEPHPDTVRATYMPPPSIRSTPVIGEVIASAPPPPHQGPYEQNWTAEAGAWDAYAAALAADPHAVPVFADQPAVAPARPLPVRAA